MHRSLSVFTALSARSFTSVVRRRDKGGMERKSFGKVLVWPLGNMLILWTSMANNKTGLSYPL
jgi:hypothetical protein